MSHPIVVQATDAHVLVRPEDIPLLPKVVRLLLQGGEGWAPKGSKDIFLFFGLSSAEARAFLTYLRSGAKTLTLRHLVNVFAFAGGHPDLGAQLKGLEALEEAQRTRDEALKEAENLARIDVVRPNPSSPGAAGGQRYKWKQHLLSQPLPQGWEHAHEGPASCVDRVWIRKEKE